MEDIIYFHSNGREYALERKGNETIRKFKRRATNLIEQRTGKWKFDMVVSASFAGPPLGDDDLVPLATKRDPLHVWPLDSNLNRMVRVFTDIFGT